MHAVICDALNVLSRSCCFQPTATSFELSPDPLTVHAHEYVHRSIFSVLNFHLFSVNLALIVPNVTSQQLHVCAIAKFELEV